MDMAVISENEFWAWAYSNFLSNAQRGVLAEYLVAKALGCTGTPRVEWDAYDLDAGEGLKVEVKSAAYLQAWDQKVLSLIRFDIAHKKAWYAKTNTYASEVTRSADVYVFCVFASQDRDRAEPLDTRQWFFLACATDLLNEKFPAQKSISLASLEALPLQRLSFHDLGAQVRALRANNSVQRTP